MDDRLPIPEWVPEQYHQAWRALDLYVGEENAEERVRLSRRDAVDAAMVRNLCLDGLDDAEMRAWRRKLEQGSGRHLSQMMRAHVLEVARALGEFTMAELARAAGTSVEYARGFVSQECRAAGKVRCRPGRAAMVFTLREEGDNDAGDIDH